MAGETTSDIPIFVDALIDDPWHPARALARCSYFTIGRDEPDASWPLALGGRELPFLLRQLVGVVTQPVGAARFTTVEQIEDLYALVEADQRFEIELAEIWLPPSALARPEPIQPGDVYRVERQLFDAAIALRSGQMEWETFASWGGEMRREVTFSPEETAAFRAWRRMQEELARTQSPKGPRFALPHRPDRGTPR